MPRIIYILDVADHVFRRHLRLEVSQIKGNQSSKQLADLEETRALLRNRIRQWRQVQLVYTPCVAPLVAESLAASPIVESFATSPDVDDALPTEPAELIPLYLPSSLPEHLRQLPELASLLEKECRLRIAQADDALAEIRHQCRIISKLWQFKKININGTGNRTCTRIRSLYNRFNFCTLRCAECYRAARGALLILDSNGSWQSRLKELKNGDIRGPGKEDNEPGNGRFEPSWIWLVPRVLSVLENGDSERVLDDSLQVEWAKVQARKQRWEEEVLLIQEEMRRVVMFFEWKAKWWRSQGSRRSVSSDADDSIIHGVAAYAEKQAQLCVRFAHSCVDIWRPLLRSDGVVPDWEAYTSATTVASLATDVSFANTIHEECTGDESEETDADSRGGDDDDGDLYFSVDNDGDLYISVEDVVD